MRILVTGDRNWRNARVIMARLQEVVDPWWEEELTLIEGEAMGADIIAAVCWELWIGDPDTIERYPADWNTHHRAAGPIRNQQMLDSGVDFVVGFHNDIENSRGTKNMLQKCKRAGIPGRLFTEEGEVTEWQQLI